MRLIDADELLEMYSYENDCGLSPDEWDQLHVTVGVLRQNIADIRTVDAVPVVRCEDCKYFMRSQTLPYIIVCTNPYGKTLIGASEDGFCNCGEAGNYWEEKKEDL